MCNGDGCAMEEQEIRTKRRWIDTIKHDFKVKAKRHKTGLRAGD